MATVTVRTWKVEIRKLTPEQVDRVRSLPWERGSLTRLSKEFGVSRSVIWNIRHGYTYKKYRPAQTYLARVTDNRERINLGSFNTPEAAQAAIDNYDRNNKWPRGSIEKTKDKGRYRVRLSLGTYDTRWAAEQFCEKALEVLSSSGLQDPRRK